MSTRGLHSPDPLGILYHRKHNTKIREKVGISEPLFVVPVLRGDPTTPLTPVGDANLLTVHQRTRSVVR